VTSAEELADSQDADLVEIHGRIAANVGPPGRWVLLAQVPGSRKGLRIVLPEGMPLPEEFKLPDGSNTSGRPNPAGPEFRFLCRPPKSAVNDTLALVSFVAEDDARDFEDELRQQEQALQPPPAAPPRPIAPDPTPRLLEPYTRAVLFFSPQASPRAARFLAERVVSESRATGLDARLLLAVLATEGSLRNLSAGERGVFANHRPARSVVAAAARDLGRRLARESARGEPLDLALVRALGARRRDLNPKAVVPQAAVSEYASRVIQLYGEVTGRATARASRPAVTIQPVAPRHDLEARWRSRRWATPPASVLGTWEGVGESFVVVINANGTGVTGAHGEQIGLWRESGGYLEFRGGRVPPLRFRWKVSDDRKALTVTRVRPDHTVVGTTTLLRR
jgi:hypothetical protein